jgi:hypothetical protein
MFCKNCGEQLPDNAHFCKKCGTPITDNPIRKVPLPSSSPSISSKIILAILLIIILIFGSIQVHNRKLAAQSGAQPAAEEQQQQKQAPKPAKESQSASNTPQISLDGIRIQKSSWGEPKLHLDIHNTDAEKTIDRYRIVVYAFDSNGTLVKSSTNDASCYHGSGDVPIAPGETLKSTVVWTLHGFDNGQKFRAKVIYLHYTDNTEWKPISGQDISLTGTIS